MGDYVWTVPNTFVASANCALYCGAKIDFVDIDPETYNISIDLLQKNYQSVPESVISIEILRCSELLRLKRVYPRGFSKGFVLNKNEYGRTL